MPRLAVEVWMTAGCEVFGETGALTGLVAESVIPTFPESGLHELA